MLACSYTSICSGCDWLLVPITEQRERKLSHLRSTLASAGLKVGGDELRFITIEEGGLRDRVDLVFERRNGRARLGLFDRLRSGIVDLEGCPQLSTPLEAWLGEFRRFDFPSERGSIRLRVSPGGERGVWLDFANVDIKKLLDQRSLLTDLMKIAVVEIGQRRKRLVVRDNETSKGELKLADPVLAPWFETFLGEEAAAQALYCTVGSFTQPGFRANHVLVGEVLERVRAAQASTAIEFGCGIGNFTLPLASICESVDAFDVDALAVTGLERSLKEMGAAPDRVKVHVGNFQSEKTRTPVEYRGRDLVLVDPPRSGLLGFLGPLSQLESIDRPRTFIYVSCFAESFAADAIRLGELGYRFGSATIVDQFPQSRHYEIVASFFRD